MLIVALGILTLLSVMALTFVSLMRLEQAASNNYVEAVRARLIAEGGLAAAESDLKARAQGEGYSDPNSVWIYAEGNYWLPLEDSSPIRKGASGDTPALNSVRASFAGDMGRSYEGGVDQYKVKVIDTQTQFNLNQQFELLSERDVCYIRFLDALGVAISKLNPRAGGGTAGGRNPIWHARYPKGSPSAARGGEAIFKFRQSREGRRFNSKTELNEVLASEDDFALLSDYVTTRSWFDPASITAVPMDGLHNKPWSDVQKKEPRSPININLATTEVIAANLCGIAGRGIFLYTGDYDTRDARSQAIDKGTTFEFGQYKEETAYGTTGVLVYIQPFGIQPGPAQFDPPAIHGAIDFARKIKDRVKNVGPFRTFAEWETFVDQTLSDGYIDGTRDPQTNAQCFPGPDRGPANPRMLQLNESPLTTPSESDIKRHKRFRQWFFDAVRSMIKANFNPNARLSGWNPDEAVFMPVDKGSLLYFTDPNQPASTKAQHQTLEWCLASKGIYEITALGEVLGPKPADVGATNAQDNALAQTSPATSTSTQRGLDKIIFAQAKVQSVLQLYDTATHTSQRDFERRGDTYKGERDVVRSYPVPRILWDPLAEGSAADPQVRMRLEDGAGRFLHASDTDGHIQLGTRVQEATGPNAESGFQYDTRVVDLGVRRLEVLFQDRRMEMPGSTLPSNDDPFAADTSGGIRHNPQMGSPVQGRIGNGWGWPFGSAPDGVAPLTRSSTEQMAWRWDTLTPDGYLNSELRESLLWFRASDEGSAALAAEPDGRLRGKSSVDPAVGNVTPTPRGGCEFWYKPDFDWTMSWPSASPTVTTGAIPDQRFCGLLATSHITQNPSTFSGGAQPAAGSWTRGTQMYITRNTSGDLRITRLYFEVVGPQGHAQEEPLVEDPKAPGSRIRFSDYYSKVATDYAYPWPPKEFLNVPAPWLNIKWARTDHWVPFQQLQSWRAHEWHHIAAWWDDVAGTVRLWLDGLPAQLVARAPTQLGPRYVPKVPNPLGVTQPPVPGPQGVPPVNGDRPAFVRLNAITGPSTAPGGMTQPQYEDSLWPKDQIMVGAVRRDQAVTGGLFKHEKDALLPANGTIDDVRFFDGSRTPNANVPAERYETGEWMNEYDLSPVFQSGVNDVALASLTFTAYLPRFYGSRVALASGRQGSVTVEVKVIDGATSGGTGTGGGGAAGWASPKFSFPHWTKSYDSATDDATIALVDDTGKPVHIDRDDKVVYLITIEPALNAGNYPIASPVVDDVSLIYFLPNSQVLLKERVTN